MKKYLSILIMGLLTSFPLHAQGITDGLRYGTDMTTGTARFNALSGAFGALGGDLSAVAINPAASSVFIQNQAAFTFSVDGVDNQATYFNGVAEESRRDFNIGQAGGVFLFSNYNENSPWKKFSLAINYNQTRSHDNDLNIRGIGNTSIANFFLEQAQGLPLELLELQGGESISDLYAFLGASEGTRAQNAFLGFQGYLFDPVNTTAGNTQYVSNVAPGSFDQDYLFLSRGYNGKFTLNFGAQYTEDLFFGINLNTHSIDYDESTAFFENNSNNGSVVNRIRFDNNLSVAGAGFSAQIGAIAKVASDLRLGITYDTPTWFVISEETNQFLETRRTVNGENITEIIDPQVINIFDDYNFRAPGKVAASAAYIFGKDGLLSFDYSYQDFSNMEFSPKRDIAFTNLNRTISSELKGVSSFKVGGEYRIEQLSLRGGFNFTESPYTNDSILGDRTGFSGGLGYNFGGVSLDFAYARSEQSRNQELYAIGLTSTAAIDTTYDSFILTLGLNL